MENQFENLKLDDLVRMHTFAEGGWGKIDLVHIYNEPTRCLALKKIKKSKLTSAIDRESAFREKQILSSIKSDFIVAFYKTFKDDTHIYFLMERLGGDLFDRIPTNDETCSLFYAGCIVQALEYLHSLHIVHRDLKPENFVLDDRGYLKMIDFGLAKQLELNGRTFSLCGTQEYYAPEMVTAGNDGYDVAVDLWALGLLVYEFIYGDHPMRASTKKKTLMRTMWGIDAVRFPKGAPADAIDFIKRICRSNPQERLGYGPGGFDELRNHCWMKKLNWEALRNRSLPAPFVPNIASVTDTSNFDQDIEEDEAEGDQQDPDCMPRRVNECRANRGGATHY